MARESGKSILKYFSTWRIIIPVAFGLSISGYMIGNSFDVSVLPSIDWGPKTILWLLAAVASLLVRDLLCMWRIRLLTGNRLTFRQAFQVVMIWEFGASVMPAFIGGSAVAFVVVHKEGIPFGRSTAVVMMTSFLDELYFVLLVPLVFLWLSVNGTFGSVLASMPFSQEWLFWAGYFFIVFLMVFITLAVLVMPARFSRLLMLIFRLPFLRRWNHKAEKTGRDLVETSRELRGKPFLFWLKAVAATFLAWTARFFIINCLIMAFMPGVDHGQLYARQLVMWVVMLVSPTPGASGVAEWMFSDYLGMFVIAGLAPVLALIWRLLTFYWYLVMGSIVLPVWIRRVFGTKGE